MRHKWLEEAGINSYPDNHWGGIISFRDLKNLLRSKRKKRKTGVDPRDCWDLDSTFYLWLYEHLCQLLNDTNADLTWRKYTHNEKEYTEEEYIEYLKKLCLDMINFDEFEDCPDLKWHTEQDPDYKGSRILKFDNSEEELEKHRNQCKKNYERMESLRKELCDVFCELLPALWW